MTEYTKITPGDYVEVEQTTGSVRGGTLIRRTVGGTVYLDDEGTLRVEGVNVTRDAEGYFPRGVVLLSHTPAVEQWAPCVVCGASPDDCGDLRPAFCCLACSQSTQTHTQRVRAEVSSDYSNPFHGE